MLGRVVLVAAVVCALGAASAAGSSSAFVPFRMPSGNIACAYVSGFGPVTLRCDILSGLRPEPRRRCELDWTGLSMGRGSATPTCAGDTVFDRRAPVLAYGEVWKKGPFTCISLLIGLSCANRTGHGFFLSKQRWVAG